MWVWCTLGGWAVHSVVLGVHRHAGVVLVVLAFVVVVFIALTFIVLMLLALLWLMTVSSTIKSSVNNLFSVHSTHLSYFCEVIK
jgi:hypothetical protein